MTNMIGSRSFMTLLLMFLVVVGFCFHHESGRNRTSKLGFSFRRNKARFQASAVGNEGDLPMRNYKQINYLTFEADWSLDSRPRRIALLIDDVQEEYREYAKEIIPNVKSLVEAFRESAEPIVWSVWSRKYDSGFLNAMDRWYGPTGIKARENALYIWQQNGTDVLKEVEPTDTERLDGNPIHSEMLDMFWNFDSNGQSILDERLKSLGVDTVVVTGLWTDECIISTAYAALSRGYDVVVVRDAVATATPHHAAALTVMEATCCKVYSTADVVDYLHQRYRKGENGEYKGVNHPDGRKLLHPN